MAGQQQCQLAAQRMNMLYGFDSPEFFDRALFGNFIDLLRERGVVRTGEAGNLEFDEVLVRNGCAKRHCRAFQSLPDFRGAGRRRLAGGHSDCAGARVENLLANARRFRNSPAIRLGGLGQQRRH